MRGTSRTRANFPGGPGIQGGFGRAAGRRRPYHFGDPHLNIANNCAGIIRMALKAYDAAHGLETERNVTAYINRNGFWQGK